MRQSVARILRKISAGTEILVDGVRPGAWQSVNAAATVGLVLASSGASPQALARGAEAARGLLAGLPDGELAAAMRERAREMVAAMNALLGPVADPEAVVARVDWEEQARLARIENPSPEEQERMIRGHGRTLRDILGPVSVALAEPGPLAGGPAAEPLAREVEAEFDMGCVPTGLSAEPGRITIGLSHPGTDASLALAVKTEGAHAGAAMRHVDGKLADFGPDRPAIRTADGLERHAEPTGAALPADWAAAGASTPKFPESDEPGPEAPGFRT